MRAPLCVCYIGITVSRQHQPKQVEVHSMWLPRAYHPRFSCRAGGDCWSPQVPQNKKPHRLRRLNLAVLKPTTILPSLSARETNFPRDSPRDNQSTYLPNPSDSAKEEDRHEDSWLHPIWWGEPLWYFKSFYGSTNTTKRQIFMYWYITNSTSSYAVWLRRRSACLQWFVRVAFCTSGRSVQWLRLLP